MAQLVTRQDQAERDLCPKGWAWTTDLDTGNKITPRLRNTQENYYHPSFHDPNRTIRVRTVKRWSWGFIKLERTLTLEARAEAYRALVKMILGNYIHVRIGGWNQTGTVRMPVTIQIMPISEDSFEGYARDYGVAESETKEKIYALMLQDMGDALNLFGWTMQDGHNVPVGEILRDGKALNCGRCKRTYADLATNPEKPDEHFCRRCVRVCPGADQPCKTIVYDERFQGCEVHFPRATCAACNTLGEIARGMGEHQGKYYCATCMDTICQRCQKVGAAHPTYAVVDGPNEQYNVCRDCHKYVRAWVKQDRNEKIVLEKQPTMLVEANKARPVRLCSVELEVVAGASYVLKELYNKGLTPHGECLRHWSNAPAFCYMEKDGSLPEYPAGGEVIFSKLRMDDATTAQKVAEAVGVIRKYAKSGDATIDLRTGTHIHIDFHKCGFNHVRNTVVLHNYIEDVIYRLGAANYTRHRGTHYAIVLPKAGISTQEEFNRHFFTRGAHDPDHQHHSVLNVEPYYKAARSCQCGHLVGPTPEACECQLGKCTVEFRVFNGTSSWKKLHAYIALCQSLVAYARAHDDLDVDDFPPVLYNAIGEIDDTLKRAWIERLTWMFKNLWFSAEERDSINYCIEHSDLGLLSYAQRRALRDIAYTGGSYVSKRKPTKPVPSPYEIGVLPRRPGSAYARLLEDTILPAATRDARFR